MDYKAFDQQTIKNLKFQFFTKLLVADCKNIHSLKKIGKSPQKVFMKGNSKSNKKKKK